MATRTIAMVEDTRVGILCRAVRRRRGWRQSDVARVAGVPQSCVSRLERGQLEHLRVQTIRRVMAALEISLPFEPRWRGGESARLLDAEHAHLVDRCAALLRHHGWTIEIEYTFNVYGERGAVDLIGWLAGSSALVIVEVKSAIVDLQGLVSTLDRKVRLVPKLLLAERGWRPITVGRLVYTTATTRNRGVLAEHETLLAAAFPVRAQGARRWLRSPNGVLSALWLARPAHDRIGAQRRQSSTRVRVR